MIGAFDEQRILIVSILFLIPIAREQGLEAGARAQLLALSLCALEQQVAALSDSAAEATAEEWRVLVGALLASCSLAAARAWLGYTPVDLQAQAASLVSKCQLGTLRASPQSVYPTPVDYV